MKPIKYSFLFLLLILGNLHAQSSQNPSEVFIQQASFDHNEAAEQFTADFITAFGSAMNLDSFDEFNNDANVAVVNQFGNSNTSKLTQEGIGNMARLNIMGNRNTAGLTQDGSNNQFILNLEGNDSIIESNQSGAENRMRLDLTGTYPNQTFSQVGSDNTMQILDAGSGSGIPLQIEQHGNGASVIIENY